MEEIKLQPITPPINPQVNPQTAPQVQTLKKTPSQVPTSKFKKFLPFILIIVIVTAGIFSGLIFSSRSKSSQLPPGSVASEENLSPEVKESFNQTFRDEAEGIIESNDEKDKYAQGTHKLIRPGGESQTAYLTSSTLDLDDYNGKKVKVFGETFGSSQVGWLMDVGKVEVVN